MKKLLLIILCFSFVFISCKNKKEVKPEATQNSNSGTKKKKDSVKILKHKISLISDKQKNLYSYNLQVSEKKLEHKINNSKKLIPESYFTENLDSIKLKISVPNNKFKFISAINLIKSPKGKKKGIVIHITDNSNLKSCGKKLTHILEVNISLKDVLPYYSSQETLKLEKKDNLYVMIFNDTYRDFNANRDAILKEVEKYVVSINDFNKCFNMRDVMPNLVRFHVEPKQGGGGVVVRWP